MWEFKFYSRGGQGAVTAAKILVDAAILEDKFAQAIPSYGQERKGAPVYCYARVDDKPIEVKSYVYKPNCVLLFDTGLIELGIDVLAEASGIFIANARNKSALASLGNALHALDVYLVDANGITASTIGDVPPNTAMLGALVRATNYVSIHAMVTAIKSKIPGKIGELNAEACKRAFEATAKI